MESAVDFGGKWEGTGLWVRELLAGGRRTT